jgi:signal transduction histidine kinase
MRVVSKVATGSALLLALLAAVLTYQLVLFQASVRGVQSLTRWQPELDQLVLGQLRALDEYEFFRGRAAVLSDPGAYQRRTQRYARQFEDGLQRLEEVLERSWRQGPEGASGLSTDHHRERALLAAIKRRWAQIHYAPRWSWAAAQRSPRVDPAWELAMPPDVEALSFEVERLQIALNDSIEQQLTAADRAIERSTELSKWALGLGLVLSLLVVLLTLRAINRPLQRLERGTREIADGHFQYRFDESRGDEFAQLAVSFNRMVARLDQLDQLKKDFVAHVSHELKSPLVTMQETNQLLAEEIAGPLTPKQRRLIDLNLHSGRRLSAMISNLLDLSSLEAGGMTFDFKAEDVAGLVRFVVDSFDHRIADQGLRLEIEPAGAQLSIIAACDRDRTLQVIENLVDNAVKFSPPGGTVTVATQSISAPPASLPLALAERVRISGRDRSFVYITVDDDGPGVPEGEKLEIFKKFRQASNTARIGTGGVGLGLAICSEIVEAHGGALWVTNRLFAGRPHGSRFHLLLPGPVPAVRRRPAPLDASRAAL